MQQSQQSAALTAQPSPPLTPNPTQVPCPNANKGQGRESPKGASSDPPSPARHKRAHGNPVNNGNQDLVIEELQSSQDKSKNRAMSIEVCGVAWPGPCALIYFLRHCKAVMIYQITQLTYPNFLVLYLCFFVVVFGITILDSFSSEAKSIFWCFYLSLFFSVTCRQQRKSGRRKGRTWVTMMEKNLRRSSRKLRPI